MWNVVFAQRQTFDESCFWHTKNVVKKGVSLAREMVIWDTRFSDFKHMLRFFFIAIELQKINCAPTKLSDGRTERKIEIYPLQCYNNRSIKFFFECRPTYCLCRELEKYWDRKMNLSSVFLIDFYWWVDTSSSLQRDSGDTAIKIGWILTHQNHF